MCLTLLLRFRLALFVAIQQATAPSQASSIKVTVVAGSKLLSSRHGLLQEVIRCNPYCAISLGIVKKQTHVLSDTLDPHWSETFSFEWDRSGKESASTMVFTVFNRVGGASDICAGSHELDLAKFKDFQGVVDDWFPLYVPVDRANRDGTNVGGSLKLRLQFAPSTHSQMLLHAH